MTLEKNESDGRESTDEKKESQVDVKVKRRRGVRRRAKDTRVTRQRGREKWKVKDEEIETGIMRKRKAT